MDYKDPVNNIFFGLTIAFLSLLIFLISTVINDKETRKNMQIAGGVMVVSGVIWAIGSYMRIKKEKYIETQSESVKPYEENK